VRPSLLPGGHPMKKSPALAVALFLFVLSAALVGYRIFFLGYPVFPTVTETSWRLSAQAEVEPGQADEIQILLALPVENAGRVISEERIFSSSLTAGLSREGPNRFCQWRGDSESKNVDISYEATILLRPGKTPEKGIPPVPEDSGWIDREDLQLAERLARPWRALKPADRIGAAAAAARGEWKPEPGVEDLAAWIALQRKRGSTRPLLLLLRASQVPARSVEGLRFADEVRSRPMRWIEAWNGKDWEILWPNTGEIEPDPASLLPLAFGSVRALAVSPGRVVDARWSVSQQVVGAWSLLLGRLRNSGSFLDRWSLFSLPAEFQPTFRILLLVPMGTLIISVLRNIIGFPTFGIFMPVLMALAFRNTGLFYGLGIFAGVVFIGYAVRNWVDRLRLLLVPRMAVMLTLVIACFTVLALVGQQFDLRQFMAVGLLPFVILTMVIERFYILVEESGVRQGLETAVGSAAVSVIAYAIISWEALQMTFFLYPELLAAVAAFQVLLGRYTGYRLSELFRFRSLGGAA